MIRFSFSEEEYQYLVLTRQVTSFSSVHFLLVYFFDLACTRVGLRVRAFLSYTITDAFTFGRALDPFRVEGDGDGDGLAARVRQFPFVSFPCTLKVMCLVSSSSDAFFGLTELPATTEGESSRGGSPQGHKAGLWVVR